MSSALSFPLAPYRISATFVSDLPSGSFAIEPIPKPRVLRVAAVERASPARFVAL